MYKYISSKIFYWNVCILLNGWEKKKKKKALNEIKNYKKDTFKLYTD